ncbi:class II histone deacetylase [Xinfangfangia sp. CPCC 101601]|uniref:Class II histone deacetylase n=1 Tax=Pseudogemmobacter lacusdianii TaxID=3069608 RepID=A0ABU0VXT4_9RHOB|nr:class II histone deacetylase [Xinfangfangia sp. CPCC 101601]MDQ2066542.1 class II histone deacetylase [Xinfangfangia sp. CPCC 101601]
MTTGFYFDEHCLWHTTGEHVIIAPVGGFLQPPSGAGHAESPETKRRLKNLVEVSGLGDQLSWRKAQALTRAEMERIHPASYLDKFKALSDAQGGNAGYYSPFGPGSFEIAALSAGLVKQAVSDVYHRHLDNAYVISRPPGHHCLPDASMGFCLLANIPLAIEALRAEVGPLRVAVVDWDVHHGNGTEACFIDRDDTLTISLHQENCFPPDQGRAETRGQGQGEGYNLNIPLLPGGGHQTYMDAFELLVAPALRAFKPDMIIVASGLDANSFDPLARMQAHSDTFRAMACQIKALADELCDGRVLAAHEGGYAEGYVPFCGLAIIEEFSRHRTKVQDPFLEILQAQQPPADFIAYQRQRLQAQAKAAGLVS